MADLSAFLEKGRFSDIAFRVHNGNDEKLLFANKAILSCRSEYFDVLFNSGFKESQESVIEVPNTNPQTFVHILRFLTLNDTSFPNDQLNEVMTLAQNYNLTALVQECEKRINTMAHVSRRFANIFHQQLGNLHIETVVSMQLIEVMKAMLEAIGRGQCEMTVKSYAASTNEFTQKLTGDMFELYRAELQRRMREEFGFTVSEWVTPDCWGMGGHYCTVSWGQC